MSDPNNPGASGSEEKNTEEGRTSSAPTGMGGIEDDILEYLKEREGKSNPVMQFLNPKKLEELLGKGGSEEEKTDPAPGTNVDPRIYLGLWSGQRGEKEHVKCIGIRGDLTPDHVPILGIYDDVLILMIGNACTEWKGATNPGLYYINHPTNPRGCAQLIEGICMFKPGLHNEQFPAFVQAEDFHINRLNEKGQIVSHEAGQFGIHLHSGGPGEEVEKYSAGCQIIWSPEGYFGATWHRFFDPAAKAMQDSKQSVLPYMLIDAKSLPSKKMPLSP